MFGKSKKYQNSIKFSEYEIENKILNEESLKKWFTSYFKITYVLQISIEEEIGLPESVKIPVPNTYSNHTDNSTNSCYKDQCFFQPPNDSNIETHIGQKRLLDSDDIVIVDQKKECIGEFPFDNIDIDHMGTKNSPIFSNSIDTFVDNSSNMILLYCEDTNQDFTSEDQIFRNINLDNVVSDGIDGNCSDFLFSCVYLIEKYI